MATRADLGLARMTSAQCDVVFEALWTRLLRRHVSDAWRMGAMLCRGCSAPVDMSARAVKRFKRLVQEFGTLDAALAAA